MSRRTVHEDQLTLAEELEVSAARELAATWATLFGAYRGKRLLAVVDGHGCVEVVFDDEQPGPNLLCLFPGGRRGRTHVDGVVADPEGYARRYGLGRVGA